MLTSKGWVALLADGSQVLAQSEPGTQYRIFARDWGDQELFLTMAYPEAEKTYPDAIRAWNQLIGGKE